MEIEIAGYREAGDDHFSARTADLEDIRDRVLGHLEPGAGSPVIPDGSVIVAADLPISRFLAIDWAQGGRDPTHAWQSDQPRRHAGAGSWRADDRESRWRRRRQGGPGGPG